MEQTDIRIRAKKISELDQLQESDNIDFEKSFIIIGYNDGNVKKNYKLPLSFIFEYVATHNNGINESELKNKVQSLIDSNDLLFPALYGPQGPQGTQGPEGSGADIDFDDIQRQINQLQSLINQYHKEFLIEYNLSYIYSNSDNNNSLLYNNSTTLYFTPYNGYVMPDTVSVQGASFEYNKDERSLRLYNPTASNNKIIITMVGNIGYYSVNLNMSNINVTYITTERSNYQKDEIIELQLTANDEYKLPINITIANALLLNYNINTGNLKFKVQGTGDVTISAEAEIDSIYYFGFAADGYDGESILGYTNSMPNGNITVNSKFYSSSTCPIDYSTSYKFMDNPAESYGNDNVWLIVPAKYFNKNTKLFLDDNQNTYRLTGGNSGFNISIDTIIDGHINNVSYVICLIANEGISDYINFERKQ